MKKIKLHRNAFDDMMADILFSINEYVYDEIDDNYYDEFEKLMENKIKELLKQHIEII